MLDSSTLIFSGFLFAIGFLGCLIEKSNVIKIILSIEIMILAAAVNFCHLNTGDNNIRIGYIFTVVAIMLSGVISSIIFTIRIYDEKGGPFLSE